MAKGGCECKKKLNGRLWSGSMRETQQLITSYIPGKEQDKDVILCRALYTDCSKVGEKCYKEIDDITGNGQSLDAAENGEKHQKKIEILRSSRLPFCLSPVGELGTDFCSSLLRLLYFLSVSHLASQRGLLKLLALPEHGTTLPLAFSLHDLLL